MTSNRERADIAELRRVIIQKIGHDLSVFYAAETQLSPRLQAVLQRLGERHEQNQ